MNRPFPVRPARPVSFNLMQIQMPVGAITLIAHRVTGVVLALGLPFFYMFCIFRSTAHSHTSA